MTWFGRANASDKGAPMPPNDKPEAAPVPLPRMSPEREQAIAKAVADGKARSIRHALFLHNAGELTLPA